jgi:hypothetical protein
MAKHTQTPWEAEHQQSDPGQKWTGTHWRVTAAMVGRSGVVADTLNRDCVIDPDEDRANAEFIVRAANCHDELLTACERALSFVKSMNGLQGVHLIHRQNVHGTLTAAIAKAGE